jgi:Ankyrin repeat.
MRHYTNLNAKDNNGCTPLDLASYAGHTDCVGTLLTSGENQADVLVYSHKSRRTALHAAGKMTF